MPSSPKFFHARPSQSLSQTQRSTILICICLLIGLSGFIFGLVAILRTNSASNCRKQSEVKSVRVVWEKVGVGGDGNGNGGGSGGILDDDGSKRYKVMGFVGIQTGFALVGRRRSLRQTWMPSDHQGLQSLEETTGLAFRFVIGRTKDKSKMSQLRKEVAEYDDFMLLDIEEEYN